MRVICMTDKLEGYLKVADSADLVSPCIVDLFSPNFTSTESELLPYRPAGDVPVRALKIFSWNIFKKSRTERELGILKQVLHDDFHEVLALQEICTGTQEPIRSLAIEMGFDYFAPRDSNLDASAKSMRNALLVRRGAFSVLDPSGDQRAGGRARQIEWPSDRDGMSVRYPPVTVVGRVGGVKMGVTSIHTQGARANVKFLPKELADTLQIAEMISADYNLDLMLVIGDANLQNIDCLYKTLCSHREEVDVRLDERVVIQTAKIRQRRLRDQGPHLSTSSSSSASQSRPGANVSEPWIIIPPNASTLSSKETADCAFLLRRREVSFPKAQAWTFPYLKQGAASEAFGSRDFRSDHRPIEVTWPTEVEFCFGR